MNDRFTTEAFSNGDGLRFDLHDAQGNVIASSDAFGEITRVCQNDAWGNPQIDGVDGVNS